MKKHVRLFEILFCVFAFCLAVLLAVYLAGDAYSDQINKAFGTSDVRYEDEDGNVLDASEMETFERDYTTGDDDKLKDAYAALVEEAEGEGLVLMKNDNDALPLASKAKVSLFGQGSADLTYTSSGSTESIDSSKYATLKDALEASGINVNPTLWDFYHSSAYTKYHRASGAKSGYTINEAPYSIYTSDVINSYSGYGDAAIMTISRDSSEGDDPTAYGTDGRDGSYLSLSAQEIELLQELTTLKKNGTFGSIIVLLNTPLTVQLDFLNESGIDVDAVLWIGNPGSHGIFGVADVLCGDVNPSGKNSDTYVYDNFSSPAAASWGYNEDKEFAQIYDGASSYGSLSYYNNKYGVYVEGIYVGYRYYETRYEDCVMGVDTVGSYDYGSTVAYPFGYGLSYTDFEYSEFSVAPSDDGESYEVSVTVTNKGSVPGKEAVEVYLQKPYTEYDIENGVEKASVELVGYEKTEMLDAAGGENDSQTVTIEVDKEQFKSYDSWGAETYILDAGDYYLTIGQNGAHDAVNNILAAKGYGTSDGMDDSGNSSFVYKYEQTEFDDDTYSVSTETGAEITNQLDFADLKKYDNAGSNADAFEYVSRSDWDGTFPTANVKLSVANELMVYDLQSNDSSKYDMTSGTMPSYGVTYDSQIVVDEETGEEIEVDVSYQLYMLKELDYEDPMWDLLLDQMSYSDQADLINFGYHKTNNIGYIGMPGTVDQNGPVSVDGSGTNNCFPCEGIWASSFNDELIGRIGEMMGEDARMCDIYGLYAPGVNMHRAAFGGRAGEYFSEDPYLTGMASVAEIKGMQSRGVIAFVKHFAFNDEENERNGVSVWLNEQSAREIYLLPFEYAMRPSMGNAHASMTSFNRAGCKWTSASSELLLNIARGEWNFEGYFITDLSTNEGKYYMTALDGIMNGTNLYDCYNFTDPGYSTYSDSPAFCTMLRESCHRIFYNVCNYSAAMNVMDEGTVIVHLTPWWQALLIALLVIAIVGTVAAIVLYVIAEVFKRRDKENDSAGDEGGVRPRDADDDYESSGDASPGDRE